MIVAQVEVLLPAPAVAPVAASTEVPVIAEPPAPLRKVRARRVGRRIVVTWRGDADRVKCGTVSKVATGQRDVLRSQAKRCKVRAAGSPWVVVRVR